MSKASNLLISSMSPALQSTLRERCTPVSLPTGTTVLAPDSVPHFAYFITSGVASVFAPVSERHFGHIGIVGLEGLVGGMNLLGPVIGSIRYVMQTNGTALRIELPALKELFQTFPEMQERVLLYNQVRALTAAQISACNRHHSLQQRLAFWLLCLSERLHDYPVHVTQEQLAMMTGTRRTSVSTSSAKLRGDGLIAYERGKIRLLDRERLQTRTCLCYRVVSRMNGSLYHNGHPAT